LQREARLVIPRAAHHARASPARARTVRPPAHAGRRDVASWPNGEYRGFRVRHLSSRARLEPLFGYTCRASVAYLALRAGRLIRGTSVRFFASAPAVSRTEISRDRASGGRGADPVRLRRAGRVCREDRSRSSRRVMSGAEGIQMHLAGKVFFTSSAILTVVQACDSTTAGIRAGPAPCRSRDRPGLQRNPRRTRKARSSVLSPRCYLATQGSGVRDRRARSRPKACKAPHLLQPMVRRLARLHRDLAHRKRGL
jgi:hypothetical protein